jgi:hypothetical protein
VNETGAKVGRIFDFRLSILDFPEEQSKNPNRKSKIRPARVILKKIGNAVTLVQSSSYHLKPQIMKKIMLLVSAAVISLAALSQTTINDPNAEKRNVSGFHAIEVGGGIDLSFSEGDEAVAVSASDPKCRSKIITEVVNGVLKIRYEYKSGLHINLGNSNKMKLKAYVSGRNIDGLRASGGSDLVIQGVLTSPKLNIEVSGGSDFRGKVAVTELKANASGGSDIVIAGTATTLNVDASGGSDFKGYDLSVENCTVEASGGSDISITATKELNIESSGGSDVYYKGTAVVRNIKSSGGGSVKKTSK